jgi:alanine dehydrogenase
MRVGTITETGVEEYRVGLTPVGVRALSRAAGASTVRGKLVSRPVAEVQGLTYTPLEQAL